MCVCVVRCDAVTCVAQPRSSRNRGSPPPDRSGSLRTWKRNSPQRARSSSTRAASDYPVRSLRNTRPLTPSAAHTNTPPDRRRNCSSDKAGCHPTPSAPCRARPVGFPTAPAPNAFHSSSLLLTSENWWLSRIHPVATLPAGGGHRPPPWACDVSPVGCGATNSGSPAATRIAFTILRSSTSLRVMCQITM